MSVSVVPTQLFTEQSRLDMSRIQRELLELQRQIGSNNKADDVKGYGDSVSQIISGRSLIAQAEARAAAANTLAPRLEAADGAIGHAAQAAEDLRLAVLSAAGSGDGRYISEALEAAFLSARTALNQSLAGEYLFSGERVDSPPIAVDDLNALAAAPSVGAIFNEGARPKTVDIGEGAFAVAPMASAMSTDLFAAMRDLKLMLDANGGALPQQLSDAQRSALQTLAGQLQTGSTALTAAQGANGELAKRVDAQAVRLSNQSDTLHAMVADVAEANVAELATRVTALQTQYQAVAAVFSNLSALSLLDYLG